VGVDHVAKKARRKPDEDEEFRSFKFPEFDEKRFLTHEMEQSLVAILAMAIALLLAAVSLFLDHAGLYFVAPIVGIAVIAFSPYLILQVRTPSVPYTKGEWAGMLALEIFAWLGLWFLLLNVFPT
jgi:hypothetical protein